MNSSRFEDHEVDRSRFEDHEVNAIALERLETERLLYRLSADGCRRGGAN